MDYQVKNEHGLIQEFDNPKDAGTLAAQLSYLYPRMPFYVYYKDELLKTVKRDRPLRIDTSWETGFNLIQEVPEYVRPIIKQYLLECMPGVVPIGLIN